MFGIKKEGRIIILLWCPDFHAMSVNIHELLQNHVKTVRDIVNILNIKNKQK